MALMASEVKKYNFNAIFECELTMDETLEAIGPTDNLKISN